MASVFSPGEKNVFGYLSREFETLDERPLGDVDSLALACASYYRLPPEAASARGAEGMPVTDLLRVDWVSGMTAGLWDPEGLSRLLVCMAASPRLRGARVCHYVEDFDEAAEKQFSACTLLLPSGGAYVSFRGTDNTLVGWREDFNMAFETGVPSQLAATAYLERVAGLVEGPLYVGGHSKGGNLAVYAACTCSDAVASRLVRVYSHDGPGFTAETLASDGWRARAGLVSKTVPRSTLIGKHIEQQEANADVDYSVASVSQPDPFSWVVEGSDFVRLEGLGRGAGFVDGTLNEWISSMTHEEREGFVDTLFSVLSAGGEDTFAALSGNWQTSVPAMLRELSGLEPDRRDLIMRALALLFRAAIPDFELPQLPQMPDFSMPQFPDLDSLLAGRMDGGEEPEEAEV